MNLVFCIYLTTLVLPLFFWSPLVYVFFFFFVLFQSRRSPPARSMKRFTRSPWRSSCASFSAAVSVVYGEYFFSVFLFFLSFELVYVFTMIWRRSVFLFGQPEADLAQDCQLVYDRKIPTSLESSQQLTVTPMRLPPP